MFDYLTSQQEISVLLKEMGFLVTVAKASGGSVKCYGVWGKSENADAAVSISQVVGQTKILYLSGALTKVPDVGDSVVISSSNWSVDKVEAYMPSKTIIAYKLTVSQ